MTTLKTKNAQKWLKWYHDLSPEEKLEHNQRRYHRYTHNYRANSKKWGIENIHKVQAANHHHTLKKKYPKMWVLTTITNATLAEWLKEKRGSPCPYCGEPAFHIDHKLPLSRGGEHTWENIQICCKFCNIAKSNLSEEEFLQKVRQIGELKKLTAV